MKRKNQSSQQEGKAKHEKIPKIEAVASNYRDRAAERRFTLPSTNDEEKPKPFAIDFNKLNEKPSSLVLQEKTPVKKEDVVYACILELFPIPVPFSGWQLSATSKPVKYHTSSSLPFRLDPRDLNMIQNIDFVALYSPKGKYAKQVQELSEDSESDDNEDMFKHL
jgi:hypothetical protein